MIRCGVCGKLTAPGEKPVRVVVEEQPMSYPFRRYQVRGETITDPGGTGMAIKREIMTHAGCANDSPSS